MKPTDIAVTVAAVAVVGVLGVVWFKRREIGEAINPTSANNLAYQSVNGVGASLTGDQDFSLGSWLFEKLNPAAVEAERRVLAPSTSTPRPTTGDFARMDRASGTYYGPPEPERYSPGEWDYGGSFGYGAP